MEKIVLNDGTELQIKPGATLGTINFEVTNFTELEAVATALQAPGNLDHVQFAVDGNVSGEYTHMRIVEPLFREVTQTDGGLTAMFGITQKTAVEMQLEAVAAENKALRDENQTVHDALAMQDGAIMELAELVGMLMEG